MFNWELSILVIAYTLAYIGLPISILAAVWFFVDDHPALGFLFCLIALLCLGLGAGLPQEV